MNQPVSLRGAPIGLIARLRLWLENYFGIQREGSTLRREIIAGATTFLAAAYVIVVNPDINAAAGIPFSAGVTATVLGLVWAYLVRFCAVALQSLQSGYARIPVSMDDSARMLGASDAELLTRIHWPMLRRSAFAALLLVFVDTMKELPATLVLRPFNSDTLAVVAYQLARDERLGEAALPSLALVLVGLLPVLLLNRNLRKN